MSLWFRRTRGLDTETMADIADAAGVSWDPKPVKYRGKGIGWEQANANDVTAIQDAAEGLLKYRPVEISEPQLTQE